MIDGEGGDGCSNHSGKLVSRECSIDKIELDLENFRFFEGAGFFFFFLDRKVTVKSSNERFEGYMIEHDDYEHGFSRIWRDCYCLLGKNFSNK